MSESPPSNTPPESGSQQPAVASPSPCWLSSLATASGHLAALVIAGALLAVARWEQLEPDTDRWIVIASVVASAATIHPKFAWGAIGSALGGAAGKLFGKDK